MDYNFSMYTIHRMPEFDTWFTGLRDGMTRLLARLRKVSLGNLGDVKPVGGGVYEMREFFGPGWRMYYVQRGSVVVVMLGGGDKSTQQADIAAAQTLAVTIEPLDEELP
jgi:putative addiction module killer protein